MNATMPPGGSLPPEKSSSISTITQAQKCQVYVKDPSATRLADYNVFTHGQAEDQATLYRKPQQDQVRYSHGQRQAVRKMNTGTLCTQNTEVTI